MMITYQILSDPIVLLAMQIYLILADIKAHLEARIIHSSLSLNMKGVVCFVLLLAVAAQAAVSPSGEIKAAAMLFRHGERTPSAVFPTYGMTKETTELGDGQLTRVSLESERSSYCAL